MITANNAEVDNFFFFPLFDNLAGIPVLRKALFYFSSNPKGWEQTFQSDASRLDFYFFTAVTNVLISLKIKFLVVWLNILTLN